MSHSLEYGKTVLNYELTYTGRGTLAIHVHPDTRVTVEAPLGSELVEIEKRVRKRAAWILRQQRNFRRYSFNIPPRQYVSGETHRLLGKQYQLKVLQPQDGQEYVKIDREHILVSTRKNDDPARAKRLVVDWYRRQALKIFSERLDAWFPRFGRFDVKRPKLFVREMRSRWGSCTAGGKMTLNLKLIQVPKPLIDYVLVHELCHVVEHNHSSAFYALLSRIMPDWMERRDKLNQFEF